MSLLFACDRESATDPPDAGADAALPDESPPVVTVVFPLPITRTEADQIAIRGTASDASAIAEIAINGVPATSDDGYATWRASVPLATGAQTLTVASRDSAGNSDPQAATVRVTRTAFLDLAFGPMTLDTANARALVVPLGTDALIAIDLDSNLRRLISDATVGTGPGLGDPVALAVDAAGTRALAVNSAGAVLDIDLASGDRRVVSDTAVGTGPTPLTPTGVAWDEVNARALVLDDGLNALIAVDLVTGNRSILSQTGDGAGPDLQTPVALALDSAANRIFIADYDTDAIVMCDGTTGARSVVSDDATGTGPRWGSLEALAWDPTGGRLMAYDRYISNSGTYNGSGVLSVDVTTGDRTMRSFTGYVYDGYLGRGTIFEYGQAISMAWDDSAQRALFAARRALLAVDPVTGDRSLPWSSGAEVLAIPIGLDLDPAGQRVFTVDTGLDALVSVDLTTSVHTVISDASNAGEIFVAPHGVAYDPTRNRVLVPDSYDYDDLDFITHLHAVDLATGDRTELPGGGVRLETMLDIAIDPVGDRALMLNYRAIDFGELLGGEVIGIDLPTNARRIVTRSFTNDSRGSGPGLIAPSGVALDAASDRALVVDLDTAGLVEVDLMTGDRSLRSSPYRGTGPLFELAVSVAFVTGPNAGPDGRAVVVDLALGALLGVDLATGDRSVIAAAGTGGGPHWVSPRSVAVDHQTDIAYVTDPGLRGLVAVDLHTGERVIIAP